MACYFFDFHDGDMIVSDDVGVECDGCDGIESVQQEATRVLAEIARDTLPRTGSPCLSIEVRDEASRPCRRADLSFNVTRL